ncbi:MAG: hypothetical protein GWP09_00750 [Nitrospiraceae bacterium]|nr:hypothetical protein [Nitrospiraceae bacterium]
MGAEKIEKGIQQLIEHLNSLQEDNTIPRNVRLKFDEVSKVLSNKNEEYGLRIDRALNIIDGLSEDANIQPYTRTQIWNVASMLESLQS